MSIKTKQPASQPGNRWFLIFARAAVSSGAWWVGRAEMRWKVRWSSNNLISNTFTFPFTASHLYSLADKFKIFPYRVSWRTVWWWRSHLSHCLSLPCMSWYTSVGSRPSTSQHRPTAPGWTGLKSEESEPDLTSGVTVLWQRETSERERDSIAGIVSFTVIIPSSPLPPLSHNLTQILRM